jgi:alpha-glucosidase
VLGARRARAALLLVLSLPGSVYLYQGEELGLPEVLDLPEEFLQDPQRLRDPDSGRDGCRVPLPWTATEEPPFGFTPPGIYESWLPIPATWRDLSVEAQLRDDTSTLSLYRAALRIRREHTALGDGRLTWHDTPDGTLAFTRDDSFMCLVNMTSRWIEVDVPANGCSAGSSLEGTRLLLASAEPVVSGDVIRLAPDSATWWAMGNL